jgi:hypothetical protein
LFLLCRHCRAGQAGTAAQPALPVRLGRHCHQPLSSSSSRRLQSTRPHPAGGATAPHASSPRPARKRRRLASARARQPPPKPAARFLPPLLTTAPPLQHPRDALAHQPTAPHSSPPIDPPSAAASQAASSPPSPTRSKLQHTRAPSQTHALPLPTNPSSATSCLLLDQLVHAETIPAVPPNSHRQCRQAHHGSTGHLPAALPAMYICYFNFLQF